MRKAILAALLASWAGIAVAQDRPFRTVQSSQDPTGPLGLLTNLNGGQEIDLINAPTTASQSFAFWQTGTNQIRQLLFTLSPTGATFNVPFANNSIPNATLAQMQAFTVKCNPTVVPANAQDCTSPVVTTLTTNGNLLVGQGLTVTGGIGTGGNIGVGGSALSTSPSGGVGYGIGSGGAVTQLTSRTTGVTLNNVTGTITLFSAAGSATAATFTVTNSAVAATDTVIMNQKSGTNLYETFVTAIAAGSFNVTFFTTGGTATDAPVFNFSVIKGSAN